MDKATYGLIGVCLGFVLGIFKDWYLQHLKRKKEYEYLSIRVVCELDRFVYGCIDVINDNGTVCGQYDKNGYAIAQVEPPSFDPYKLDVEWKSLPHKLMYEILNFPNKIENANEIISAAFEYDDLPTYDKGFDARHFHYTELGIQALELASKLRILAGLPPSEASVYCNPSEILPKKKIELEERKKLKEQYYREVVENLNKSPDGTKS
ncbi:hypothetical protein WNY98_18760 [Pseudoalteromonas sp. AS71]|uniref:hypothetical protein n=1 Tax=Pseudoalteromonas sp. AS71 TaxID=3135777 RepID=UPI00316CAE77